ncbi:MAG TPA: hypothetical protein VK249_03235, partial [Anaerolineales bacterium]|nr:hypothetical protein [Anaerolineales bacterium]
FTGRDSWSTCSTPIVLFFFALLHQFVDPDKGNVSGQTLFLGSLFVSMSIVTDSLYALLANFIADRFRGSRHFQKKGNAT